MANYAYLCVSNHATVYPAFADPAYDSLSCTVARGSSHVPLTWFGLFRPRDLVTHTFATEDGPYTVTAPLATRERALAQLDAARPRMGWLFAEYGQLDEYIDLLATAIEVADGTHVTIEWDEIDVIADGSFLVRAIEALGSVDPAAKGDPDLDRERLLRLAGLDGIAGLGFPPARHLLEHGPVDGPVGYVHTHLIGTSNARSVPWEP